MQRTNKLLSAVCVAGFAALSHGQAIANVASGTATMTLSVGGTIAARPCWSATSSTDCSGELTSGITFTFSGFAESTATADVNSATVKAYLLNATSTTVALTMPKLCKIGSTDVDDGDVLLVTDAGGSETPVNSTSLNVQSGEKSYKLRFKSTGGREYGNKFGSVSCTAGSMTYSY